MRSRSDPTIDALRRWLVDDARERLARARGAADADPRARVLERHAGLRSARARESFEEALERGLLHGHELAAAAGWLRDAHASVGRARAEARLAEVLGRRVPHDSDHHDVITLFARLCRERHAGRRRALGRSIEEASPALLTALREGLADVEEAREGARWLDDAPSLPDRAAPEDVRERAAATLGATNDVWAELCDRLAHATRTPLEAWPDLLFVLRADRFDDLVAPRRRFRRLAAPLAALGVVDALSRRARVEGEARGLYRPVLIPLTIPHDIRIVPSGLELGLHSELEAARALGRAVALAWTHPALPPLVSWPEAGTVGWALGGLFAHLGSDPVFVPRGELGASEARLARETRLALELWALRTQAAAVLAHEQLASAHFADAAREHLRGAWRLDVHPFIAALRCMPRGQHSDAELRANMWVAPLHVALRERYDEDYWRNPRAAEPLRAAAERGPALSVEAWAEELGAAPSSLGERYAELAG